MTGFTRYGWYRYGYVEYRAEERATSRREEEKGLTEEELFGSGVALRSSDDSEGYAWDFVADSKGDLAATVGGDELRKDLAFATARESYGLIGTLASPNDQKRLEKGIERTASRDSRITSAEASVKSNRQVPHQIDAEVSMTTETEKLPRMVIPVGGR